MIRRPPRSTLFPYTSSSDLLLARPHLGATPKLSKKQQALLPGFLDRKSTRLNSSHVAISYAVFCLKKKKLIQLILDLCFRNSSFTLSFLHIIFFVLVILYYQ